MTCLSKAETLEKLESILHTAKVLPQIRIEAKSWQRSFLKQEIMEKGWESIPLIVRSSAKGEDGEKRSLAGHFTSVANVRGMEALFDAIETVISSYDQRSHDDQVFIQPLLTSIAISGVIFSKDPNTEAPYRVINYDDLSGRGDLITSGTSNRYKLYYAHQKQKKKHPPFVEKLLAMVEELEELHLANALDIEFAITKENALYLLQVRPLVTSGNCDGLEEHVQTVQSVEDKIKFLSKPHPYLLGKRSLFGVMPDWNPAEIIGMRPRPLALSLYKMIVTDNIWAYQRHNYGYRNLRGFPLMVSFSGLPYIDVRVSFNSFVPAALSDSIATKLIDYYLDTLEGNPSAHDKVEFEVLFTCYTFDLPKRIEKLENSGFFPDEIREIVETLRDLTRKIIDPKEGHLVQDLKKIEELENRFETIQTSTLDPIAKIYWLLEDCARYGTLPFAGIARAGFIAIELLQSLVSEKILTKQEYDLYLSSLDTVCSEMQDHFNSFDQKDFLQHYGHLREGTYDLLSPRYDEAPERYFNWEKKEKKQKESKSFFLNLDQMKRIEKLLKEHGLNHSLLTFFDFLKAAIEGREYAKFVFTKSLSAVLRLVKELGAENGIDQEQCTYLNIKDIVELYAASKDVTLHLQRSVVKGKAQFERAKSLILPPLITEPEEVWGFGLMHPQPNFITLKKVSAKVVHVDDDPHLFAGNILFIPSADPGFDWVFTHKIGGLVTLFGGANSHMAIRAQELKIPAVIGAGEQLFSHWKKAHSLEIDCEKKCVSVMQ